MADGVEVNLTGLDSLLGKLDAVSQVTRDKAGRAALRKAANVIRDRARNNAARVDDPLTKEAIYKNIVVTFSSKTFRRTGDPTFRVGVMGGSRQYGNTKDNVRKGRAGKSYKTAGDKGNPGGDTWHWRFLEFGTEHMAAKPILRPAVNGVDTDVINVFAVELEKAIDRAVRRAAKKGTSV
ncbi:HK97 gp10 family phage protein [Raoultella ornithinolytica]|uniref:HK97-gp10 family putative phage morphogenesis protein n=1 Tax=Raoultella ornithinolytica TaxID=54291 RepID=UPI001A272EC4|nr:HK97-gp10 family putative phage morphogenesis protein [Raoultella ornithinolytica]MDC7943693.1 HK97 gp10 family phage protein [Raoultella ornithinolytica]MDV0592173.1 HK97 gp10 family phage protein [Raoultella ornithinolytica]HAT1562385.1 HK97 gp10 family phage protein [Raoultella ornithinolytica]HAZ3449828.1 HK97 gp10 family phage protein [Raoultella ornithinolytica]HDT5899914.1 HK97 gp10 family phage protein [Raoultella ornithinolytica]